VSDPRGPFDQTLLSPGLRALDYGALAAEFGTPLFVYDEDEMRRRCREYVEHFGAGRVAYASKAFLCTAMARLVAEEGLALDVATGGELHVAQRAGFPAARIVMHGNNKSDEEIAAALAVGVGRIVLDSFDEIERVTRLASAAGVRAPVLIRVTPGVEAHTHEFIETGTEASKFGFSLTAGAARTAVDQVVASPSLDLVGLHCHIGSQIFVLESYARAARVVVEFAAALEADGITLEELDFGGGLGVRYLPSDPEVAVADYAVVLLGAVQATRTAVGLAADPAVTVEPGRSIVAPAAVTVYRVGTVKHIPRIGTYVAVDGGMSDNARPVLYGAGYEAFLPGRIDAPRPLGCSVVGKHCEQGDIVVADAHLPADVAVGDVLVTPVTGAYGYSMASNYNKVPRPAVLFVREGRARVVVRRETLDDLSRLDEE
jgi:diaminopimelate decarboxylase